MDPPLASSSAIMAVSSPPPPARRPRKSRRANRKRWLPVLLLSTICATTLARTSPAQPPTEAFHETLLLKPLPDGRVLSSFEFTLTSTSLSTSNFRLLPRSLLQPIQHFGVSEVQLSLNSGRWRYDSWGSPVTLLKRRSDYTQQAQGKTRLGEESVGAGAELWARFDAGAPDDSWKGLTSSLAGLFCTSLDALDERHTVQPHYAFAGSSSAGRTLHAALPSENVCTENLTPFIKLLPCKNAAGIATLLNPLSLFGSNFHGLMVHVRRVGEEAEGGWEVKLVFTSVFAPAVTRDVSIRDWSIGSLFGRSLEKVCPLAAESAVRVLKPEDREGEAKYQVDPLPSFPECSKPGEERHCPPGRTGKAGKGYVHFPALDEVDEVTDSLASSGLLAFDTPQEQAEYDQRLSKRWAHHLDVDGEYLYDLASTLSSSSALDIKMSWPHETRFRYPAADDVQAGGVQVERTLIGSGQERTVLQVVLTNRDERLATRVLWYETLGWFVQPLLHTLSHTIEFLPDPSDDELLRSVADLADPVQDVVYQPSGGEKPFVLEAVVRLPAHSRVVLQMELRKGFVRYSRHPPDAHRGFDLNGAVVWVLQREDPRQALKVDRGGKKHTIASQSATPWHKLTGWLTPHHNAPHPNQVTKPTTRIYTLPRLVQLATPDFSFVYTNIIFTSTVVALFFGSSLNTLLRTFSDFVL